MTRIKSDEGELDALATYLEAVQVFLRQHIHSRNDICCSTSFHLHMREPDGCCTVPSKPQGEIKSIMLGSAL